MFKFPPWRPSSSPLARSPWWKWNVGSAEKLRRVIDAKLYDVAGGNFDEGIGVVDVTLITREEFHPHDCVPNKVAPGIVRVRNDWQSRLRVDASVDNEPVESLLKVVDGRKVGIGGGRHFSGCPVKLPFLSGSALVPKVGRKDARQVILVSCHAFGELVLYEFRGVHQGWAVRQRLVTLRGKSGCFDGVTEKEEFGECHFQY